MSTPAGLTVSTTGLVHIYRADGHDVAAIEARVGPQRQRLLGRPLAQANGGGAKVR